MLPKTHFLFGIIFVGLLYFIFPQINFLNLSIIFLSSVLIDIDHVLYYLMQKKDINPLKAYNWYIERCKNFEKLSMEQKKKFYSGFYIFHGIEPIIILFLLGLYSNSFFIFICIGFSFHFLLDIINEIYCKGTFSKVSLVYNYYRFKKLNP